MKRGSTLLSLLSATSDKNCLFVEQSPNAGWDKRKREDGYPDQFAAIISQIFNRYVELGNVRLLAAELEESGICSPPRNAATGRAFGGRRFSRGHLYRILSNPIYIARIDHGGRSHEANHPPIIEQQLWSQGAGDPRRQ